MSEESFSGLIKWNKNGRKKKITMVTPQNIIQNGI